MTDKQTKNNIKQSAFALLALLLGEGVLGIGIFWPFILLLSEWTGVYWFGLAFGIMVSLVADIALGLPSLFMVVVFGLISMFVGVKRSSGWILVILAVVLNLVFDLLFDLDWSFGEALLVFGVGILIMRDLDKQEEIRINY
jgi:hypothetical protein